MAAKKRQCIKGKSCGRTCISKDRICRVEAEGDLSKGLKEVSKAISDRNSTAQDIDRDFLEHIRNNSFETPGRSFSGSDLAEMISNSAKELEGEARDNINKLKQFIVKDDQVVFIASPYSLLMKKHGNDEKEIANEVKKWSMSTKFVSLLDKSFMSGTPNYLSKRIEDVEKRLTQNLEWVKKMKVRIAERDAKGYDTSIERDSLKKANSSIRKDRKLLRGMPIEMARRVMGLDGEAGWTMQGTRFVVLNEGSMSFAYDKGRKVDAKSIQDSISKIIETRGKATPKVDPTLLTLSTHDFAYSYDRPKATTSKLSNERILQTYVHELGHQVHFRAGSSDPPLIVFPCQEAWPKD